MKVHKGVRALAICAVLFLGTRDASAQALHRIAGLTVLSNGAAQLALSGSAPGQFVDYFDLYRVEASSDLQNWTSLGTALRTNASTVSLRITDADAPQFAQRFYRTPTNHLITALPKPTGPYAVGRIDRTLIDTNRPGRLPFMISTWYPAAPVAGVLPGLALEREVGGDAYYWGTASTFIFQVARGHALPSAPVATTPAVFPVILYSHGYGGLRTENTDKTEDLASHGFVVVGIDHPDAYASILGNQSVVYGQRPADLFRDMESRVNDVRFVLEELSRMNISDPLLAGRLDLERVGLFGWSFGGIASVELCATDARFKAAATLDGGAGSLALPEPLGLGFTKPVLILSGDLVQPPVEAIQFAIRRVLRSFFDKLIEPDAYWIRVVGTVHGDFGFNPWFYSPTVATKTQAALAMRAYLVSFFNKYLRGQDDHLLDGPSSRYPSANPFLRSALMIATPPQNLVVRRGSNATLMVTASSPLPIQYQWQREGTNLPGATATNYAIVNAQSNHIGTYTVTLNDCVSTLTTPPAFVDVGDPPVIVQGLTNQTSAAGSPITFVVTVTGTSPFGYEWRKGSLPVASNTLAQAIDTYTIPNVRTTDAGSWRVIVRNKFNLTTTVNSAATLTVP